MQKKCKPASEPEMIFCWTREIGAKVASVPGSQK